jgi:hypothetical protein
MLPVPVSIVERANPDAATSACGYQFGLANDAGFEGFKRFAFRALPEMLQLARMIGVRYF